jgi:hypothetical protein
MRTPLSNIAHYRNLSLSTLDFSTTTFDTCQTMSVPRLGLESAAAARVRRQVLVLRQLGDLLIAVDEQ